MAEGEEELKSLLMREKEESKNDGLKCNIKNTKVMASGPITSWQINEEKVEMVTDFFWGGSKITVDSDCSTPGFPVLQHLMEFPQIHVH